MTDRMTGRELLETGDDNTEECGEDDDGRFGQIVR